MLSAFSQRVTKAILIEANLSRADLKDANLSRADLSSANLSRAEFWGKYGVEAQNITPSQIKKAKNWEKAKYSPEFRKKLGLPHPNNRCCAGTVLGIGS